MFVPSDPAPAYQEFRPSDAELMAMKAFDERQELRADQRDAEGWLPEADLVPSLARESAAFEAPRGVIPPAQALGPP